MREDLDEITQVIRRHWDRRANTFDEETGHGLVSDGQRLAWLDLLSRLVGPAPQEVLDVGCGTGFLALRFAELGHTATGIDLAPQMIDHARRKAEEANEEIDFRVGDAAALDWPDEHFDWVVARHVIWNLPDPQRAVEEWLRVLRPGGRLVLIEGKWAYNEVLAPWYGRPASRLLGRVIDGGAALASRSHASYRRYHRIEAQLPFSGVLPLNGSSRSSKRTAYMTSYSSPSWTRRYGVRSRDFRVISSSGRDPASESPS